ncbi:MAG: ImmA/IrrE family metallo-endopeptidase [Deltaproteobacteria bacterium]|nr:ImmA/IrrE family metallo-endopeptidase [Deltaproteobacteria bacterium]MBW2048228.1 ImmA/IrrE family metallo-endopeptidase [Deltaproteobacteria bacterium]MBW2111151.1 ImmA/IrrE family metallo-endopeptidase [Deltaproteobacteria bacterium]MBW2353372.1 ImmA/IrrE family metallo-endopeptidase [Deltaproteobacteria bacterium]
MKVPRISRKTIAQRAHALLDAFQTLAGYRVRPPVPVDEIVERALGLRLFYVDLEKALGYGDVLGATYVDTGVICINERLFEQGSEGRLVFTCAHEAGHWVLHRRYAAPGHRGGRGRTVVCRLKNAREPIEWQADYFAACLLMPEAEVREAFDNVCGSEPLIVRGVMGKSGHEDQPEGPFVEQWPFIAAAVCQEGGFSNVSMQAMIIRLQELGLLINRTSTQMNWEALRAGA